MRLQRLLEKWLGPDMTDVIETFTPFSTLYTWFYQGDQYSVRMYMMAFNAKECWRYVYDLDQPIALLLFFDPNHFLDWLSHCDATLKSEDLMEYIHNKREMEDDDDVDEDTVEDEPWYAYVEPHQNFAQIMQHFRKDYNFNQFLAHMEGSWQCADPLMDMYYEHKSGNFLLHLQ